MNLPPFLLLNLGAALPRARHGSPLSHRDVGEPDWRSAYLRLRGEEPPTPVEPPLLAPVMRPGAAEVEAEVAEVRMPLLDRGAARPSGRGEEEPLAEPPPAPPAPPARPAVPEVRADPIDAPRPAPPTPPTPTAVRIEALRQVAEPGPLARVWQVELPALGPAWQLRVEQAQPLAPLNLALQVPPVAQSQARQQLGDLDRRLREAGHDVLRPRVRALKSRGPVDGVKS